MSVADRIRWDDVRRGQTADGYRILIAYDGKRQLYVGEVRSPSGETETVERDSALDVEVEAERAVLRLRAGWPALSQAERA